MTTIIKAKGLTKEFEVQKEKNVFKALFSRKYKKIKALDNVDLEIKKGEFVGVVGPNGAGKSTLIKILTGILLPSRGKAVTLGNVPYEERQKNAKNIGVVFGQRSQLWWDLPVYDSFDLLKTIYEIKDSVFKKNMKRFNEVLGLKKYMGQQVRKLSLGERMRCELAVSLLHSPQIVYLDEPTIGLDVEAKFKIRNFLKQINEEGTTVLLTTHDMGDIEELCPRIIIIDHGKKIYDGPISEIKKIMTKYRMIIIDYRGKAPKIKLPKGAKISGKEGDKIIYKIDSTKISASRFIRHILNKYEVDDISIEEPSIEEVIRKIYKEGI